MTKENAMTRRVTTTAVVLGILVGSAAAVGASTAPEQQANTAQAQRTGTDQKETLEITFTSDPNPPKTGENTFDVSIKGSDGNPMTDADVSLTFYMAAMPEMNMPEMRNRVALKHRAKGQYRGTGNVMMAGRWDVTVVVKKGDKEIGSQKFTVTAK
ncbi:MAG: FixH family protein [Gemmatimonadaceae bacterium]|nr:FixH family protein [Gemmatimonadaceae bacterium]